MFDAIESSIGALGRWQWFIIFIMFYSKPPVGWHQLSIVVQAPPLQFNCSDSSIDKCSAECPSHSFDRSVFTETIETEFDLVCGKHQLKNVLQMFIMAGILIGNTGLAILSDKFGRKWIFLGASAGQFVFGTAAAYMPNFWGLLVFKFLSTVATGGTMCIGFTYLMEVIGVKWRTFVGTVYQIPFYLGHSSLGLIAYYLRDWKHIQLAISVPSAVLLICILMPESPRWLLSQGKQERARVLLEKIAKCNGLPTEDIKGNVGEFMANRKTDSKKGGVLDLFRTWNIRKNWLCASYNWLVCGFCYFGVAQMMGQLSGSLFLNVGLSGLISVPGTIVAALIMNRLGRKITLVTSNIIGGVGCVALAFIPMDMTMVKAVFGIISTFGLSMAFCTVYIYSGELFPTVIRTLAVGTSSTVARVGAMVTTYFATAYHAQPILVPLVYGIIPLIGAGLALLLPETANCVLPETIEDAELFGKKVKKEIIAAEEQPLQQRTRAYSK